MFYTSILAYFVFISNLFEGAREQLKEGMMLKEGRLMSFRGDVFFSPLQ